LQDLKNINISNNKNKKSNKYFKANSHERNFEVHLT